MRKISERRLIPKPPIVEAAATAAPSGDDAGRLLWRITQFAIIGTFLIAFCAALQYAAAVLVPVMGAMVIGTIFGPVERRLAERGLPSWVLAVVVVLGMFLLLQACAVLLSASIINWIRHASDFSDALRDKLQAFQGGIEALHSLQKAVGARDASWGLNLTSLLQTVAGLLSPTLAELLIFFATLFFYLLGREAMRRQFILSFASRANRLRTLKIISDIEGNLARYFATVTLINIAIGMLTFLGTWMLGVSNPLLLGALAFACNYIPYIGPAFVLAVLFAVGLVSLPTLTASLWAPLLYLGMTTIEGNLITPRIVGLRLTLNPFAILLALTFWTFLWGPAGAFLSVPFLIVGLAIRDQMLPDKDIDLPA